MEGSAFYYTSFTLLTLQLSIIVRSDFRSLFCCGDVLCIHYLLTYYMEQSPFEKLTGPQLVKKFPAFYGTRRFITTFTSACRLSLTGARSTQSMPSPSHFLKIRLNIILPSMPGSSMWSPSLRFPHQNNLCTTSRSHTCYIPRPSHSSLFDHPNKIWRGFQIITLLIMWFSTLPLFLPLLDPNVLLGTLFINTLSLRSSVKLSDQFSHSYKTTGKIIVLYILIFKFSVSKLEDKDPAPNDSKLSLTSICS